MEKKPLSKITVSEIIADCNVNRRTFYYHFYDIYALPKWVLDQEAVEVVRNLYIINDYESAINFTIDCVANNKHILNCAYDGIGRDELKRFFYNDFASLIQGVINDTEKQRGVCADENFKDFLCDFPTEATAGMLVNIFRDKTIPQKSDVTHNVAILSSALPELCAKSAVKTK